MRKTPRKIKHWAEEAYDSLQKAITLFHEKCPYPSDVQRLELVDYAVPFAALNRGFKKGPQVDEAYDYVIKNVAEDLSHKAADDDFNHSIAFLLAYLDAQVSFGIISEVKSDDIMRYLSENYEISIRI